MHLISHSSFWYKYSQQCAVLKWWVSKLINVSHPQSMSPSPYGLFLLTTSFSHVAGDVINGECKPSISPSDQSVISKIDPPDQVTDSIRNMVSEQVLVADVLEYVGLRSCLIRVFKTKDRPIEKELSWYKSYYPQGLEWLILFYLDLNVFWPLWYSHFSYREDFFYRSRRYLVLRKPAYTLAHLLEESAVWPLPRRHIREIAIQILHGVLGR